LYCSYHCYFCLQGIFWIGPMTTWVRAYMRSLFCLEKRLDRPSGYATNVWTWIFLQTQMSTSSIPLSQVLRARSKDFFQLTALLRNCSWTSMNALTLASQIKHDSKDSPIPISSYSLLEVPMKRTWAHGQLLVHGNAIHATASPIPLLDASGSTHHFFATILRKIMLAIWFIKRYMC